MTSAYSRAASAYGQAQQTRGDLSTIVELYDRSIATLQKARQAREENRFDQECEFLDTVVRVFTALKSRLNHQRGGAVAKTLDNYYDRLIQQILLRHKAADRMAFYDSLVKQVAIMRDAWSQLAGRQQPVQGKA